MCGFAGIVDFRGRAIAAESLYAAGQALAHRGPDARGEVFFSLPDGATVGLVHRRLSVLDLSEAARQPMGVWAKPGQAPGLCKPWQAEGADLVLVYNGEIYNHRELRDELTRGTGFQRRSDSDSETLLAGYAQWGESWFEKLRGMWALAVVDRRPVVSVNRPPVLLCRDRYGKKPLLWAWHDRRLLFASEMRAMIALARAGETPLDLNLSAVEHLLNLGFTLDPVTIFSGVHSLPAGCLLTASADGPQVRPWHTSDPRQPEADEPASISDSKSKIQNPKSKIITALDAAVRDRLIADVPLGAFLSGGIDSSIVVYHLARCAQSVSTFHIGFPDQPRFDETAPAQAVAQAFGARHTTFPVTARDLQELIPQVLDHLGEPFADSSLLPTWILSRLTRRHVTVALSGDGGDELFGGYQRYRAYGLSRRLLARMGAAMLALLPAGKQNARRDLARQARKFRRGLRESDPVCRHLAWIGAEWPPELLTAYAQTALTGADPQFSTMALYQSAAQGFGSSIKNQKSKIQNLDSALHLDFALGLPNDMLKKADLAGMAHGLEIRCPFLDPRVVALAQSRPADELLPQGRLKGLLIETYRDVLPRAAWDRPKHGFELPIGAWLCGPLREFFWDTVSPANVAKLGLFNRPAIERLLAEQAHLRREHGQLLWTLVMLHGWAQRWR